MQLNALKCILAVSQYGSMNRAAQHIFLSQPAVSAIVSSVEEELGYPVFIRTKTGVVPTENGIKVIREAETIAEIIDGWHMLGPTVNDSEATVTLAYNLADPFPALIRQFAVDFKWEYPSIDLRVMLQPDPISALGAETFDLALFNLTGIYVNPAVVDIKEKGWRSEKLFSDRLHVFFHSQNPLADRKVIHWRDLTGQTFALPYESNSVYCPYRHLIDILANYRLFYSGSEENAMIAVERNLAVAFTGASVAKYNRACLDGSVCSYLVSELDMEFNQYIITKNNASNAETFVAENLKQYLKKRMQTETDV